MKQGWNGRFVFYLVLLVGVMAIVMGAAVLGAQATPEAQKPPPLLAVNAFPNHSFDKPVDIAHAGDERLFVVEQSGVIRVVNGRGPAANINVFLDIKGRVTSGGEMGLLGLAFHPQYAQNGYFYVNYTTTVETDLTTHISRFQVTADPDQADPASELILLQVSQPYSNHNGGGLKFGPDRYLYIGLGDGGASDDPGNRAQNRTTLLGKMLRIDVDKSDSGKNYGIPADNPFVGEPALDEIWALGVRNPWRFSFDRLTGDLYIGDVGQNLWEEINFQPADSTGGENYGWRLKEGNHCFIPAQGCDPGGLTDPIFEYHHSEGCSVTGGTVYRGLSIPALHGYYLYADYCTGEISALRGDGKGTWQNYPVKKIGNYLSTFGEDNAGEVYLAQRDEGTIYRLVERRGTILLPLIR